MITLPDEHQRFRAIAVPLAIILPEDPSQEELAQYWTLSAARSSTRCCKCRGEAQRRRFAVQLCTLRTYGRFLARSGSCPDGHHQSSRPAVGFAARALWRSSRTFGHRNRPFPAHSDLSRLAAL